MVAKPNDSPRRAALMQLLNDIKTFEETGELPAYATEAESE